MSAQSERLPKIGKAADELCRWFSDCPPDKTITREAIRERANRAFRDDAHFNSWFSRTVRALSGHGLVVKIYASRKSKGRRPVTQLMLSPKGKAYVQEVVPPVASRPSDDGRALKKLAHEIRAQIEIWRQGNPGYCSFLACTAMPDGPRLKLFTTCTEDSLYREVAPKQH